MKIDTKRVLFNRYIVFAFFLAFFTQFISWAIDSGFVGVIKMYISGSYDGPYTLREYLDIIINYELYPELGFRFLQLIMPVLPVLIIIPFLDEAKTLKIVYPRVNSYKAFVLSKILKYIFVGSLALFMAFVCYLVVGMAFVPFPDQFTGENELFSEIFGKNFYAANPIGFFIVQGFLRFFLFPFVYGLFGISIAFLTFKKHLCVLVPIGYYTVMSLLVACFNEVIRSSGILVDLTYLSPAYTVMSTSREYINGFVVLAPLFPVLLFSIGVIIWDFTKKRNRGDVFAV